jgi:hypothetical protein
MSTFDLRSLAKALSSTGVIARIGESSHYKSGHYVAVEEKTNSIIFEKIEENEYSIRVKSVKLWV